MTAAQGTAQLSADQIAFIRFAVEKPRPFAWRWLDADGEISLGLGTHRWLAARKMVCGFEVQCRVTVAELDGLAHLWSAPLVELNSAGVALLAEIGRGPGAGVAVDKRRAAA